MEKDKIDSVTAINRFLQEGNVLQLTRNSTVYKAKIIGSSPYARRFRNTKKIGIPIFFALTAGPRAPKVDVFETDKIITAIRSLVDLRKKVRLLMIGTFAIVIFYARIPMVFIAETLDQALEQALAA